MSRPTIKYLVRILTISILSLLFFPFKKLECASTNTYSTPEERVRFAFPNFFGKHLEGMYKEGNTAERRCLTLLAKALEYRDEVPCISTYRVPFKFKEEGLRLLEKVYQEFPRSEIADDAIFYIWRHFHYKNNIDRALEMLTLIEKNYPDGTSCTFGYDLVPTIYLAMGDYVRDELSKKEKALEYYEKVIKKYPKSIVCIDFNMENYCGNGIGEALIRAAKIYIDSQERDKAIETCTTIVKEYPEARKWHYLAGGYPHSYVYEVLELLAIIYKDKDILKTKIEEIIATTKSTDTVIYALSTLAREYTDEAKLREAVSCYERMAYLGDLYSIERVRKVCIENLSDPVLAEKSLKNIIAKTTNNKEAMTIAMYQLGLLYINEMRNESSKGIELLKKIIFDSGKSCYIGDDYEGPCYSLRPTLKEVIKYYSDKGETETLIEYLDKLLETEPHWVLIEESNLAIGISYYNLGEREKAQEYFRKVLAIGETGSPDCATEARKYLELLKR